MRAVYDLRKEISIKFIHVYLFVSITTDNNIFNDYIIKFILPNNNTINTIFSQITTKKLLCCSMLKKLTNNSIHILILQIKREDFYIDYWTDISNHQKLINELITLKDNVKWGRKQ